ncbi:MAG: response regulator [Candidatus Hydrogenedentes bacterium]|nr:response regulator [Candidatus Hydrogenedentota bacterium]
MPESTQTSRAAASGVSVPLPDRIREIRSTLVDRAFIALAFLAPLIVLASVLRIVTHGWHPIYLLHYLLMAAICAIAVARKRLPYRFRVTAHLFMLYAAGTGGLIAFGVAANGMLILVLFAVFSTIILGARAGAAAMVLNMITILAIGALVHAGLVEFQFDAELFIRAPSTWFTASMSMLLLMPMVVSAYGKLHTFLLHHAEAAQASEEVLSRLVEHIPAMVHALDENLIFTLWNRESERVTGYPASEMTGNPDALKLLFPDEGYRSRVLARLAARGGDFRELELDITCKSGEVRTIAFSSASHAHPIAGWAHWDVGTDVTERRRLEKQFQQSQKMEVVGQLAGGVAHDFNNLLQVIHGYVDFALEDLEPGSPLRGDLEEVSGAAERATVLVRQLLAFSRRQVLELSDVNLCDVVEHMLRMIARILGEHIAVEQSIPAPAVNVRGDKGQLEQVLLNLCINARDAMPGGGRLRICVDSVTLDGRALNAMGLPESERYARLEVADTGCGMDSSTLSRIYEPFFSTKPLDRGTGLGLATVYGIVKQHQGAILVESALGRGATFQVYFPMSGAESAAADSQDETALISGTGTVLLVEDDAKVRALTREFLVRAGFSVICAEDGEEALALLQARSGELRMIISDVVMPRLGGMEFFERVRQLRPAVPVLFTSGYDPKSVQPDFELRDGVRLLQKPYTRAGLYRKIRLLLGE